MIFLASAKTQSALTIAALALAVWIIAETMRRKTWINLICLPAIFGIGVSCGLPLYLVLRSRRNALGPQWLQHPVSLL